MPRLQSLKIFYCYKLKPLPDYLCTAPLLKELEIFGSLLLEESYKTGAGENWPRISPIPNIILGWANDSQHNEFGPQINDKDDVEEINDKDDVVEVDKNH
ncbi:hypothetical protein CFP56_019086 [Quercus suber]|uniref:Uncharacterized protein n=1 Tax=Quercus suber TaxID=58331 RepID=A0AAW0KHD0_QUESU